jgi:hypothetical protein
MMYLVREKLSDEMVACIESLKTNDLQKIYQRIADEERWEDDINWDEHWSDILPRKTLLSSIFNALVIFAPRSEADKWMLLQHWFHHTGVRKCGENL